MPRGIVPADIFPMLKRPSFLLRLEGLTLFTVCLLAYHHLGANLWHFFLLLLVPDLSMAGYVLNVRVGAATYNAGHTLAWPLAGIAAAWLTGTGMLIPYALIWLAHIGLDRVLGYGLKYPTHFHDTHLQRVSDFR
jgi:hypothetical protein